ncbi:MAG TPA: tripartite tricarboxylate transporter TctB family protein [Methylomirabilota bacterium]|nr:tripartite tricarboxylate transporter TctB family protein [Methylomirabilota bacterium]
MRELAAAVVLLAAALAGVVEASRLALGRIVAPGPGFFPFALALGLAATATLLVARALRRPQPSGPAGPVSPGGRTRLLTVVGALFGYAAVLGGLGFVVATFLLMVVLFRAVESQRWAVALAASASSAILGHLLFKVWLGVRLPPGPWGF